MSERMTGTGADTRAGSGASEASRRREHASSDLAQVLRKASRQEGAGASEALRRREDAGSGVAPWQREDMGSDAMPALKEALRQREHAGSGATPALREALRLQERECAGAVPGFACVAARLEARPSPLAASRWPALKGARLAASLVAAQLHVASRAVLPAALAVSTAAVGAACLAGSAGLALADASWWFSALFLMGAALTMTLALSSERADALALATPVGPQAVVLARLAAVLGADALAGIAASAAFSLWGSLELGTVVGSWLAPLALVVGASAFVAVWSQTSWAGAIAGAALVPFVLPVAQAASAAGAAALVGVVQEALGPAGLAVLGAALMAAAVCSSRRAALARLQAV